MRQMAQIFVEFMCDERGATAIEYGFIAALMSVATMAVIGQIGGKVSEMTARVLPGLN